MERKKLKNRFKDTKFALLYVKFDFKKEDRKKWGRKIHEGIMFP